MNTDLFRNIEGLRDRFEVGSNHCFGCFGYPPPQATVTSKERSTIVESKSKRNQMELQY